MDDNFLWPEKAGSARTRLFNLLSAHAQEHLKTKNGVLDVRAFAEEIGKSHEGVYRWMRSDYFPAKNIPLILAAASNKLTKRMLLPYVTVE